MKVSVEKTEAKFEPVTFSVTLETRQEMVNLMRLLQRNGDETLKFLNEYSDGCFTLAKVTSELKKQMGDIYYQLLNIWEHRGY